MTNKRKVRRAKLLQTKAVKRFENHRRLVVRSIYAPRTPVARSVLIAACMLSRHPSMSQLAVQSFIRQRYLRYMHSQFKSS